MTDKSSHDLAIIKTKSHQLYADLLADCRLLQTDFPSKKICADNDKVYFSLIAYFLTIGFQLATDVINSANDNRPLIAIIGARSLLELETNINFIFIHPDHINDNTWKNDLYSEWLADSNDPDTITRLKGTSMKDRFKVFDPTLNSYIEYGHLSTVAHMHLNSTHVLAEGRGVEYGIAMAIEYVISITYGFNIIAATELQKHKIPDRGDEVQSFINLVDQLIDQNNWRV